MKRLIVAIPLLLMAGVAFGFDPGRRSEPGTVRIAILKAPASPIGVETMVQTKVARYLASELKSRGFDAYETAWTYEDAAGAESADADYYVEIASAGADSDDVAGLGIGGRHVDVSIGVVISHVAAELHVYDARTMELIASENLHRRSSALMPTSIGLDGGDIFGWIALPLVHRAQYRSAARAAARDAAAAVAEAVR